MLLINFCADYRIHIKMKIMKLIDWKLRPLINAMSKICFECCFHFKCRTDIFVVVHVVGDEDTRIAVSKF